MPLPVPPGFPAGPKRSPKGASTSGNYRTRLRKGTGSSETKTLRSTAPGSGPSGQSGIRTVNATISPSTRHSARLRANRTEENCVGSLREAVNPAPTNGVALGARPAPRGRLPAGRLPQALEADWCSPSAWFALRPSECLRASRSSGSERPSAASPRITERALEQQPVDAHFGFGAGLCRKRSVLSLGLTRPTQKSQAWLALTVGQTMGSGLVPC